MRSDHGILSRVAAMDTRHWSVIVQYVTRIIKSDVTLHIYDKPLLDVLDCDSILSHVSDAPVLLLFSGSVAYAADGSAT